MIAKRYHTEVYKGITHVIPTNDELDHAIDTECNCQPRVCRKGGTGVWAFHTLMSEVENG